MGSFTWDHTKSNGTCDVCDDRVSSVEAMKEHQCPASSLTECHRRGHPQSKTSLECYCGQVQYEY